MRRAEQERDILKRATALLRGRPRPGDLYPHIAADIAADRATPVSLMCELLGVSESG